jgi:hypothetical protein
LLLEIAGLTKAPTKAALIGAWKEAMPEAPSTLKGDDVFK